MTPRTPLLEPTAYFRRDDRPSFIHALGYVVLTSVLVTGATYVFIMRVFGRFDLSTREMEVVQSEMTSGLVLIFVAALIGWLIVAAIMHVLLWLASAEGGIVGTLTVVGEAYIVSIVLFPALLVGFLLLVGQAPTTLEGLQGWIQSSPRSESGILLLVGLVSALWQAYIQSHGFVSVHDVSDQAAYAIAFGVGIIGWLFTLI